MGTTTRSAPSRDRRPGAVTPGTVSVVIPCHDYGHYLATAVESALDQTGVDLEVVVVDDHSTDATPGICGDLAARDPRVRVRTHPTREGHIATFNDCLDAARGDYVVLLSADDALVPGALARAARFLDDEPNVGMVYGHAVFFTDDPPPVARTTPGVRRIRSGPGWIARRCHTGVNCISSPEVMMRAATLDRVGRFRPELPLSGDLDLWLRMAAHADVGHLDRTDQAYYRRHPDSLYRSTHHVVGDLEARRAAFLSFFATDGDRLRDPRTHERDVRVALADEALWKACRAFDRGRVDQTPIGGLMFFAATTWPDVDDLPRARALRRRIRLGERACTLLQPFGWYAVGRRIADEVRMRRWIRTGDL